MRALRLSEGGCHPSADTLLSDGSRVWVLRSVLRAHPTWSCLHMPAACWRTLTQGHSGRGRGKYCRWGPGGQGHPIPWSKELLPRIAPSWKGKATLLICSAVLLRKNYNALCQMYEKIQPLLENLHGNFTETRNNIGEQRWGGLGRGEGGRH